MKGMLKGLLIGVSGIVFIFLIIFVLQILGLANFQFFAPKYEEARRNIFEETKSYNEAKEQDLLKYRLEYLRADDEGKEAIASTIRLMYADYDYEKLNPELQSFLKSILYGGLE